jgi:cobaltochelatase CobN
MNITGILTVHTPAIAEAAEAIRRDHGVDLGLKIFYPQQCDEEQYLPGEIEEYLAQSDLVLLDIRGQGRSAELAYQVLSGKDGNVSVINFMGPTGNLMDVVRLGAFTGKDFANQIKRFSGNQKPFDELTDPERLEMRERFRKVQVTLEALGKKTDNPALRDAGAYMRVTRYYQAGGADNYYRMFLFLAREYFGYSSLPEAADPVEYPQSGIFHPELGYFSDLDTYLCAVGYKEGSSAIGFLFYGGMHLEQNISSLKAFFKAFSGYTPVPVYSDGLNNLSSIRTFFSPRGKAIVEAVVNLMWFRLNGGPMGGDAGKTQDVLRALDVPVFAPACLFSQDIEKWKADPSGLNLIMAIMAVIWPELDGCIEPIPCCGGSTTTIGDCEIREVVAIEDRVERITARIKKWLELGHKPPSERRVAFIIYNYPPGEANLGGAAYLDVFESVRRLLSFLCQNGYTVDVPDRPLHEIFDQKSLTYGGEWADVRKTASCSHSYPVEEYRQWFDRLPEEARADVIEWWGEPPGTFMVDREKGFIIPGLELHNVFIGVQPSRPSLGTEDLAEASHDKTKPPHHQYLAFYHWLETTWKADCVIHVGTHGLAEFTKGKEIGLSSSCFPDILIGNLPHLYYYHVVNTSESTIAKRRLNGTLISYNSPPFMTSGLYDQYLQLEDLVAEYHEAVGNGQDLRAERVKDKIGHLARESNLSSTDISEIHLELYELKRTIIPKGLHILGEQYDEESRIQFLCFILRYDRPGYKSLNRFIAEYHGIDYQICLNNPAEHVEELTAIDNQCHGIIEKLVKGSLPDALEESGISGNEVMELKELLQFGNALSENYIHNEGELRSLAKGLDVRYIEPRLGGDVIRTPEVLPTGTNMNQFDPTKIPTAAAAERGAEIARNTLRAYVDMHGKYPESVGIVLWGFETTKTGGESIGQVLELLGVRVVRKAGSWSPEIEVIPLEELNRPRVDCLLTICGFFRDMFPNLVQLLGKAFSLVSRLDEPEGMNYVRSHTLENLSRLDQVSSSGVGRDLLFRMASGRIYGPRAGEYGTRMLGFMEDSVWRDESDLAEIYIDSMNHLYADNIHAQKADDLYRSNLSHVTVISQVRDTHDYEIVDLDHYFEFFGGLSKAVETVSGKSPVMMISDTTREVITTEDVGSAITRGSRTRILNPNWSNELLKHQFHGAQKIEDRVYNLLGLAATTHAVKNWIWSEIADRYIHDGAMREKMLENNRYATAKLVERLLEAERREYWDATPEELEKLRQAYIEIEGFIEERTG